MVTSFLLQAHPVSSVYAGPIVWEATDVRWVMRAYCDFLPSTPAELGAFVGLETVPTTERVPRDACGRGGPPCPQERDRLERARGDLLHGHCRD